MRGDADQVTDVRNRRESFAYQPLGDGEANNTRFCRSENALPGRVQLIWFGSVATRFFLAAVLY